MNKLASVALAVLLAGAVCASAAEFSAEAVVDSSATTKVSAVVTVSASACKAIEQDSEDFLRIFRETLASSWNAVFPASVSATAISTPSGVAVDCEHDNVVAVSASFPTPVDTQLDAADLFDFKAQAASKFVEAFGSAKVELTISAGHSEVQESSQDVLSGLREQRRALLQKRTLTTYGDYGNYGNYGNYGYPPPASPSVLQPLPPFPPGVFFQSVDVTLSLSTTGCPVVIANHATGEFDYDLVQTYVAGWLGSSLGDTDPIDEGDVILGTITISCGRRRVLLAGSAGVPNSNLAMPNGVTTTEADNNIPSLTSSLVSELTSGAFASSYGVTGASVSVKSTTPKKKSNSLALGLGLGLGLGIPLLIALVAMAVIIHKRRATQSVSQAGGSSAEPAP